MQTTWLSKAKLLETQSPPPEVKPVTIKEKEKANLDEEGGSAKSQAKRRKVSESPVKLMTGSRKRTTEHPGLVGKRKRRTTKEVQAERAEKEACALAVAEAKTNAVAQSATLEIVSKDDDAEVFDWSPVNNYVKSDSEMVEDLAVVAATPKQKELAKFKQALLADVEAQKAELHLKKASATGKRQTPTVLPLASRLKLGRKAPVVTQAAVHHKEIGRLTDDHTLSSRPAFQSMNMGQDFNVQNVVELIGPNSTDSSSEKSDNVAVHPVPKVKHTSKPQIQRRQQIVTPDSDSDSPICTTTGTWKLKTAIVPKQTNRMNDPKVKAVNWSSVLASQITAAKSFKTLPSLFSNSHTIKKFRAICYSHWMRSDDPFNDFMLESPVLLSVVQQALEEAFPNNQYTPHKNDIFHQTIYDNINMHHSNLACTALSLIKLFVSDMTKSEIWQWVQWTLATRLGEVVYAQPCPPGYSIVKDAPNFQKPKGFLLTSFVIELAKPHMKAVKDANVDFSAPHGLLALILVALERAVWSYKSGTYVAPQKFGAQHAALVTEYLCSLKPYNKWNNFYNACNLSPHGHSSEYNDNAMAETSQTDIGRRALLFSSSPVKA
ncbi:hypothetical protein BDN71DRAFT_1513115 [Pleurotus eryngii]|uniref:Uncharacterized protein n=1 Tax=Pleurotus eryngii TaxID=5323 RepID=A0A9P6DA66_PLEER|nr:hypothetical protein BDN71DRAFT_1513115 [Pleurotus eryngii]